MQKETQFRFGATMAAKHKNGKLSILIKLTRLRLRD
jgi:hypothetical protein